MSHPNIIYGSFGDEKVTSSAKIGGNPLGNPMVLPDGRWFRHAKASGTALVVGKVYQQNAFSVLSGTADAGNLTGGIVVSGSAGEQTVVVTMGGTGGVNAGDLIDGYLFLSSGTAGGQTYKIKNNTVALKNINCTITLYPNDKLKTTLCAGSTLFGVRQSEYNNLTLTTADTVTVGSLAGVAPVDVAANYYCWIQRTGVCSAYTQGTLIVGEPVCLAGSAGGVTVIPPAAADTAGARLVKTLVAIGDCLNVSATVAYSLINLRLTQ